MRVHVVLALICTAFLTACSTSTTDPTRGSTSSKPNGQIQAGKTDIVDHIVIYDVDKGTLTPSTLTLDPTDIVLVVIPGSSKLDAHDVDWRSATLAGAFDISAGGNSLIHDGYPDAAGLLARQNHFMDYTDDNALDCVMRFRARDMMPPNKANKFRVEIDGVDAGQFFDYQRSVDAWPSTYWPTVIAKRDVPVVLDLATGIFTPNQVILREDEILAIIILDNDGQTEVARLWKTAGLWALPEIGDEVVVGFSSSGRDRRFKQTHFMDYTDDYFFGPVIKFAVAPLFDSKGGQEGQGLVFEHGGKIYSFFNKYRPQVVKGGTETVISMSLGGT